MNCATIDSVNPKLCKDCKHVRPFTQRFLFWTFKDMTLAKCAAAGIDLCTGGPRKFCDIEREFGEKCGRDGKLWEAA